MIIITSIQDPDTLRVSRLYWSLVIQVPTVVCPGTALYSLNIKSVILEYNIKCQASIGTRVLLPVIWFLSSM